MRNARRLCSLAAVIALFAVGTKAQDKKREAQLRTVRGVVTDKSDNALSGSVVFLKNMRTNSVRSSYTDDTGNYRFSGLDPNADYELHAEKDNEKTKRVSTTLRDCGVDWNVGSRFSGVGTTAPAAACA